MYKQLLKNLPVFIILLCSSFSLFSQGTLRGTVYEEASGLTVPFATVFVTETAGGTTTDLDGVYSLTLPAGTYTVAYSFIGFATTTVTEVEIKEGEVNVMDINLAEESQLLEEIVVTAKQIRNTEAAILTIQKKSANLLDGISSQSFRRIGDSDAGSAIKRVTGVSVEGGKYVFVRGLGDRYTKSILNGVDIPGLDPDRNTLQLDVFPTNLIDNIIVVKSFTPDLAGDFTGGVVNLVTKDFPESKSINFSGSLGYTPGQHLNESALGYQGSSTDRFGFDNGLRNLPFRPENVIPRTASGSSALTSFTNSFSNIWEAQNESQFLDYSFGFSAGNQIEAKKVKIGYNIALNYKNSNTFFDDSEFNTFLKPDFDDADAFTLQADRTQLGGLSTNNVLATGLVGTAVKWDNHKISLSLLRIQNGETKAGEFTRQTFITSDNTISRDNLEYTERAISNALLTGKHLFNEGDFEVEWKLSPTLSQINDRDIRLAQFRDEGGIFSIEPSEGAVPIRIFRGLEETNYAGKLDLTKKLQIGDNESKIKVGASYVTKNRNFGIQNYEFNVRNSDAINFSGDADEILAPGNVWTPESNTGVFVVGNFEPANTYDATQNVLGLYAMNELQVTDKLKAVYGARFENFQHIYSGQNNLGDEVFVDEELINEWDVLPALNLIYSLTDKTNLRASFSRTVARPSFKEVSLAQIYDALSDRTFIGNLDLVPTDINNFDLRWESFQEKGQLFAVSAFYKSFSNPIELVAFSEVAPDNITPRNVGDATVLGVEIEVRKSLDFIDPSLSVGTNVTLVSSSVEFDTSPGGELESRTRNARPGEEIGETRQLQGQSPFIINSYLNYALPDQSWEANLSYNVQGRRLAIVGISQNPDVFEQPFHSLNAKVSRKLGEDQRMRINLSATNILNARFRQEYESFGAENQTFAAYSPGTAFSLGLSYKL